MSEEKKSKGVTPKQEQFIENIIRGMSRTDAYLEVFEHRRGKDRQTTSNLAYKLFNKPQVKQKYEQLLEEHRAREREKTEWTRQQSIEALQFVVNTNKKDLERIQQAAQEELEQLEKDIAENPELARELVAAMIKQKKKTRANLVNNTGIISAVAELNKMQGYNEQNINMNSAVMFTGDDQLED